MSSGDLLRGAIGPVIGLSSAMPAPPAGAEARQRQEQAARGNSLPVVPDPVVPDQLVARTAEVSRAVTQINEYVQTINRELQFSIDEASGHTVIKVLDITSGQIIRQIPEHEVLALAKTVTPDGGRPRPGLLMAGKA